MFPVSERLEKETNAFSCVCVCTRERVRESINRQTCVRFFSSFCFFGVIKRKNVYTSTRVNCAAGIVKKKTINYLRTGRFFFFFK